MNSDEKKTTQVNPDIEWLMGKLGEMSSAHSGLWCLHCGKFTSIEKILAEKAEYCSCGAAWLIDGLGEPPEKVYGGGEKKASVAP